MSESVGLWEVPCGEKLINQAKASFTFIFVAVHGGRRAERGMQMQITEGGKMKRRREGEREREATTFTPQRSGGTCGPAVPLPE